MTFATASSNALRSSMIVRIRRERSRDAVDVLVGISGTLAYLAHALIAISISSRDRWIVYRVISPPDDAVTATGQAFCQSFAGKVDSHNAKRLFDKLPTLGDVPLI